MQNGLKKSWKVLLLLFAVCIALFSLLYTNKLANKLAEQEKRNTEIWAKATNLLVNSVNYEGDDQEVSNFINAVNTFCLDVAKKNTTIPAIMLDQQGNIMTAVNLDSAKLAQDPKFQYKKLAEMQKLQNDTIIIRISDKDKQFIYYENSTLLTQVKFFPIYQLVLISLFLMVSYLAFNSSRRSEQNRVWVGLAKETAHQLGTPTSSLLAWIDLFRASEGKIDNELITEMERDVKRLEIITERFSKIGSEPVLRDEDMRKVLNKAVDYLRSRVSNKVAITIDTSKSITPTARVNIPLFEWVVENLCKNAVDAMEGQGRIDFMVTQTKRKLIIDVKDTGKGILPSQFKTVFKPGFTTKKRGWGLGLSLAKRIIESYHKGNIFVKESTVGKGTTFRIVLNR
ncbi:MAG TPA: HAMP domain-containing sensor histidine kinase [Bacteroidia bacterium]|nr:HAMP domain-containing sensor histidine kinase [Bacteroidia bacterium]